MKMNAHGGENEKEPLCSTPQSHHDYLRNGGELQGVMQCRGQEQVKPQQEMTF